MSVAPGSYPKQTFELRILLQHGDSEPLEILKTRVADFLVAHGMSSFVEGTIDDVDIDNEPGGPERDFYGELGGNQQPLSVYKYSREALEDLKVLLDREFKARVSTSIHSMETETWMEGWKESFKPIATRTFYVYPPWDNDPAPEGLTPIVIEPGMAFGTGQHATTQLCLRALEDVASSRPARLDGATVYDVGTGTGILAIAAEKLGSGNIIGTDVDPDALIAGAANGKANHSVAITFAKGSVPQDGSADIVIANILTWVLKALMASLTAAVRPGGVLLLSGLLVEDEVELIKLAEGHGMRLRIANRQDGWACLVMEKRA